MKVREVMTSDVVYCQPNTTLAGAAIIMWQRDCGVVPVVDAQKRVVGMITDRDICIATAMQNRLASEIEVCEIISGKVKSCRPNDDLEIVLKTMRKNQLRRLPVTDKDEILLGIISISDLLNAEKSKDFKKKLFAVWREISSFRPVQLHEIAVETLAETVESTNPDHTKMNSVDQNQFESGTNNELEVNEIDRVNAQMMDAASEFPRAAVET